MYVPSPSWVDQRTHGALGSHNGWCAAMYMSDVHSSYRGRARRTQDEEAGREKAGGSERMCQIYHTALQLATYDALRHTGASSRTE